MGNYLRLPGVGCFYNSNGLASYMTRLKQALIINQDWLSSMGPIPVSSLSLPLSLSLTAPPPPLCLSWKWSQYKNSSLSGSVCSSNSSQLCVLEVSYPSLSREEGALQVSAVHAVSVTMGTMTGQERIGWFTLRSVSATHACGSADVRVTFMTSFTAWIDVSRNELVLAVTWTLGRQLAHANGS